jgi:polyphosphate kinase
MKNPNKRWQLSPMDIESRERWVEYSRARKRTDRKLTPWHIVNADNEKTARLNCIAHLLHQIPCKNLRPVQLELPPRQPDDGYIRPKKSGQKWVPEKD